MRHNLFLWNTLERTPSNFRYIMYNYGTVVLVTLISHLYESSCTSNKFIVLFLI